jgi:hypothetical protein
MEARKTDKILNALETFRIELPSFSSKYELLLLLYFLVY